MSVEFYVRHFGYNANRCGSQQQTNIWLDETSRCREEEATSNQPTPQPPPSGLVGWRHPQLCPTSCKLHGKHAQQNSQRTPMAPACRQFVGAGGIGGEPSASPAPASVGCHHPRQADGDQSGISATGCNLKIDSRFLMACLLGVAGSHANSAAAPCGLRRTTCRRSVSISAHRASTNNAASPQLAQTPGAADADLSLTMRLAPIRRLPRRCSRAAFRLNESPRTQTRKPRKETRGRNRPPR